MALCSKDCLLLPSNPAVISVVFLSVLSKSLRWGIKFVQTNQKAENHNVITLLKLSDMWKLYLKSQFISVTQSSGRRDRRAPHTVAVIFSRSIKTEAKNKMYLMQ